MKIEEAPSDILSDLNPPQLEAVTHTLGPLIVLAGAGSGKTRVLTRRIAYLVNSCGVNPQRILAVTFTNKATEEMRERLISLLGDTAKPLWIATFHSAALRLLRYHAQLLSYQKDFIVYDEDDTRTLLKRIIKELNIDPKKYSYKLFSKAIDRAKNDLLSPEQFYLTKRGYDSQLYTEVYDHYQRALLRANAMDFGDLLFNVVELLSKHPEIAQLYQEQLQFVLVDEFQDTNKAQYLFLQLITKKHRNVFVVGDDDQSIYAFRGADPQNILQFRSDYPSSRVIKLEQNYRSTSNILDAAHCIIEKNRGRSPKKLWTAANQGDLLVHFEAPDEEQEAAFVAQEIARLKQLGFNYHDIAVFYRTNAQSRALEEALMSYAIPFRIYGGLRFYDRKEIKDIIAYLRLLANQNDNQAFQRVVNTPTRGIGAQAIQALFLRAKSHSESLFQAACLLAKDNKAIATFVELIKDLQARLDTTSLSEMIRIILDRSGYLERLKTEQDLVSQSRIENLEELKHVASSFDQADGTHLECLSAFLDRVALSSSSETASDQYGFIRQTVATTAPDTTSLMTLHLAKGLEFPVVFLTGLEEGLLPHHRSKDSEAGVEEERRLCYVGITRAKQKIYLTHAQKRGMFSSGSSFGSVDGWRNASRFFYDIPSNFLERRGLLENLPDSEKDNLLRSELSPDQPAKAKAEKNCTNPAVILTTADQLLEGDFKTKTELSSQEILRAETVTAGMAVVHPSFGHGVIESIDGDCIENPQRAKLRIKFESFQESKILVFAKSRLRVA